MRKILLVAITSLFLSACSSHVEEAERPQEHAGLTNCHQIGMNRYNDITMPVFECHRGNESVLAIYDGGNTGWRIEDGR